jgi:hypothetical protein
MVRKHRSAMQVDVNKQPQSGANDVDRGSIEGCKYALLYCAKTGGDGDGGNEGCVAIQALIPVFVGFIPVIEPPLYNGQLNLLATLCPGL